LFAQYVYSHQYVKAGVGLIQKVEGGRFCISDAPTQPPPTCEPSCANGGTCIITYTSAICRCPCGWTGVACTGTMVVFIQWD